MEPSSKISIKGPSNDKFEIDVENFVLMVADRNKDGTWNCHHVGINRPESLVPMFTALFRKIPAFEKIVLSAICNTRRN